MASCPRARPGGWVSCVFSPRVPSRWATPQGREGRGASIQCRGGRGGPGAAQGEVDAGGPRPDHASYLPPLPGPQAPRGY